MASSSRDDHALGSILNAARGAARRERSHSIMQLTRQSFRSESALSRRPQQRSSMWKATIFLLKRCNVDFFPSRTECSFLNQQGLGKRDVKIDKFCSMQWLHSHICQLYPVVSLERVGFRFAICLRNKKIEEIPPVQTTSVLQAHVGRSNLIIIPNADLKLLDETSVNNVAGNISDLLTPNGDITTDRSSLSTRNLQLNAASHSQPRQSDDRIFPSTRNLQLNAASNSQPRLSGDDLDNALLRILNGTHSTESVDLTDEIADEQMMQVGDDNELGDHGFDSDDENLLQPPETINFTEDEIAIHINRNTIVPDLIEIYNDEMLVHKPIKVEFLGEIGIDQGGLTKEMFTEFWKKCASEYFRGHGAMVPYLPLTKIRKGLAEHYKIFGRILAHSLILTKSLPTQFAKSVYLKIGDVDRKITDDVLQEDFMSFVTPSEKLLINKAIKNFSALNQQENDMLLDFFQTYGLLELPKEGEILDQVKIIAENLLIKEPLELIKKIKDGIPLVCENFFLQLNGNNLQTLYRKQAATPAKIIGILKTEPEELNSLQTKSFYFLKTYIRNLRTQVKVERFLQFVTGAAYMPSDLKVSFKQYGWPTAHTCSNFLELASSYNTYQELECQFEAILATDDSFAYTTL